MKPRIKLCVPRKESFPIPLKYIDVTRTTYTSLDVMLEKQMEDYWNVDGERELSDARTGFTRFVLIKKGHRKDTHGPGGDLQGSKQPLVLMMYGQMCGNLCPMQRKKQNKDGLLSAEHSITHPSSCIFLNLSTAHDPASSQMLVSQPQHQTLISRTHSWLKIALRTKFSFKHTHTHSRMVVTMSLIWQVENENAVGSRRAAWRVITSVEQNEKSKGKEQLASHEREYVAKVEGELQKIRDGILAFMNKNLVSSPSTGELQVFYYKMKGDYYRYLAEFAIGEAKSKSVEDARIIDDLSNVDRKGLNYQDCEVLFTVSKQSPDSTGDVHVGINKRTLDIAGGVDVGKNDLDGGADNQGTMFE